MSVSCTVITNPLSGGFSPQRLSAALEFLAGHGFVPDLREADNPDRAAEIALAACTGRHPPLIIVGAGDGTINAVVNGLPPGVATLGVLPFGTSNVLCRELGITSTKEALEKVAGGIRRDLCVGCMEKNDEKRTFLLMAGVGIDGLVVKKVVPREKRLLKKGAYLLSSMRVFCSWEQKRIEVISGLRTVDCHSVIVCNGSKYGGNLRIAPDASIFEPDLRVFCMEDPSRLGYLKLLLPLLAGKGLKNAGIQSFATKELEIRGEKPLQADGDYYFDTPLRIRAIPNFLKIIV
ncbi:MAG TPA: diacylglycerol kinase family protein [Geobacteraceae bacterium]|nr:diacylglycerol kinase family protein [Geobacteraceae bacterium]